MSNIQKSNVWRGKDLITTGIFSAIYFFEFYNVPGECEQSDAFPEQIEAVLTPILTSGDGGSIILWHYPTDKSSTLPLRPLCCPDGLFDF